MNDLYIIKIGGNVIDDPDLYSRFISDFAGIKASKLLVHGGGKLATQLSSRLGITLKMVDGRRITDEETLKIITMVYGGLINKNLVAKLQACGCNAVGLTGADADLIPASKRIGSDVDYGYVGDPIAGGVNIAFLQMLLSTGFCPVIAPVTHNGNGDLLNTNADTIASVLAVALTKFFNVKLIFCFEKPGVLSDHNDEASVISSINYNEYLKLKNDRIVSGGMFPKLENAFNCIKSGVTNVLIGRSTDFVSFVENKNYSGTVLLK